MSLDVISSERGAPVADDPAPVPVAPSMPPRAAHVPPVRSDGYAQRSTIRSNIGGFVIVAALHGAALVWFILYRSPEIVTPPPARPLVVTLLPLARPPAEMREKESRPEPARIPSKPASIRPVVPPIIPTIVNRDFALPAVLPPTPPPAPAPAPPIPAVLPAVATPVSGVPGNARDSWEGRVLARLERFKRFPAVARGRREQGVATIRFRLSRQGRVLSSSIAHSAGNGVLDQEALATLARAEPLPPIPAGRPDEVELVVPIEFVLGARR